MKVGVFSIPLDRMLELEDCVGVIVLRTGNQGQTKMCFRRCGILISRQSEVTRRFSVSVQVVKRHAKVIEHFESVRREFVDSIEKSRRLFVLFAFGQDGRKRKK